MYRGLRVESRRVSRVLNLSRSFSCSNVSSEGSIFMNVNSFHTRKGGAVVGHAGKGVPLMLKK